MLMLSDHDCCLDLESAEQLRKEQTQGINRRNESSGWQLTGSSGTASSASSVINFEICIMLIINLILCLRRYNEHYIKLYGIV